MAKSKKQDDNNNEKNGNPRNPAPLKKTELVANISAVASTVNVGVTFTGGLGQVTASVFRNGVLINMQSISASGNILFSDVTAGDVISVNGVCSGKAVIAISAKTLPSTPENFDAGIIMAGYLVQ